MRSDEPSFSPRKIPIIFLLREAPRHGARGCSMAGITSIASILRKRRTEIEAAWMAQLALSASYKSGQLAREELRRQADAFLKVLNDAIAGARMDEIDGPEWAEARAFLDDFSKQRVLAGFAS